MPHGIALLALRQPRWHLRSLPLHGLSTDEGCGGPQCLSTDWSFCPMGRTLWKPTSMSFPYRAGILWLGQESGSPRPPLAIIKGKRSFGNLTMEERSMVEGPDFIEVPDLAGLTLEEAQAKCRAIGIEAVEWVPQPVPWYRRLWRSLFG
jgi:hypothetical protein